VLYFPFLCLSVRFGFITCGFSRVDLFLVSFLFFPQAALSVLSPAVFMGLFSCPCSFFYVFINNRFKPTFPSWSRRSLDRDRPCAGLILRRSAFSFACVGIVVVMSSYVIFILAAMRLYNSISISFRFVGRARSCLESLRRIAGCRLPWRISDPGASAHWPTPVRLSLSSVHLPSAWRNNRLSSVIGNTIREESCGCSCRGGRVICKYIVLSNTLRRVEHPIGERRSRCVSRQPWPG